MHTFRKRAGEDTLRRQPGISQKGTLIRNRICKHYNLGFPASGTRRKQFSKSYAASITPGLIQLSGCCVCEGVRCRPRAVTMQDVGDELQMVQD